jgi:hypothetical protein
MKKLLISILLLATFSCGKVGGGIAPDGSTKCGKSGEVYLKAISDWQTDPNSKAKCEAVKKALNDILKDCSIYTAAQRKVYEDELKNFTCD